MFIGAENKMKYNPEIELQENFRYYDNPKRALKVWREYIVDLIELDVVNLGLNAVRGLDNSDRLDFRLNQIVTNIRQSNMIGWPNLLVKQDIDTQGLHYCLKSFRWK
jgi:hypothetical protein